MNTLKPLYTVMNNNQKQPIQLVTTLGKLASVYGVEPKTLMEMIKPYDELNAELENYFRFVKDKGKKVLTPLLTQKILTVLGEP